MDGKEGRWTRNGYVAESVPCSVTRGKKSPALANTVSCNVDKVCSLFLFGGMLKRCIPSFI